MPPIATDNYLKDLDYSIVQQCMHCGMCLPTCPTYDATLMEKHSPRGRISLMRAVADGKLDVNEAFGDEMYFCLGCLACQSACPAGVNYTELFEMARAEIERTKVLDNPVRDFIRSMTVKFLFMKPWALRLLGRMLWIYQRTGMQTIVRKTGLLHLLPRKLRELEPLTPTINTRFSDDLIHEKEFPLNTRHKVGLLTGCVQDIIYSDINRDTVDVLLANDCEVITPRDQHCCGSLHGHNGEWDLAKQLARKNIDSFPLHELDAIITNAGGCGSHLKHYDHLLADDPVYAQKAKEWSRKVKDISEWLVEIDLRKPNAPLHLDGPVTYHESCHLCHGQKITAQPRILLQSIPGLELRELPESNWCCGSAGIYNITQPEMSAQLLERKLRHIDSTGAKIVASANPGCNVQISAGIRNCKKEIKVLHPVSLLAEAYRRGNFLTETMERNPLSQK